MFSKKSYTVNNVIQEITRFFSFISSILIFSFVLEDGPKRLLKCSVFFNKCAVYINVSLKIAVLFFARKHRWQPFFVIMQVVHGTYENYGQKTKKTFKLQYFFIFLHRYAKKYNIVQNPTKFTYRTFYSWKRKIKKSLDYTNNVIIWLEWSKHIIC